MFHGSDISKERKAMKNNELFTIRRESILRFTIEILYNYVAQKFPEFYRHRKRYDYYDCIDQI